MTKNAITIHEDIKAITMLLKIQIPAQISPLVIQLVVFKQIKRKR